MDIITTVTILHSESIEFHGRDPIAPLLLLSLLGSEVCGLTSYKPNELVGPTIAQVLQDAEVCC